MSGDAVPEKILVFVPAYNCAPQIGRVIAQLEGPAGKRVDELVVIDNGSRDGTVDRAAEALPRLGSLCAKVVRNRANYNLGGSHKAAFAYALANGFSHVVVLHGDDQGCIDDILPVLERGDHRTHDACLGARFMRGSRLAGYSRFRIFGNRVFNLIFTATAGRRVLDLGSGLNIFARSVFADPAVTHHADDLRFNVYLLLGMIDRRADIMFFPISWREDDQISNVRMFSQARRTLAIARDYVLRRAYFRTHDHRDQAHASYEFEVVAEHVPTAGEGR
jgi:glycosyltransferase involved in cell wall biosynthesis